MQLRLAGTSRSKRGKLCHYRPCFPTTVRGIRFDTEQRLLTHQKKYHGAELKARANSIAEQALRRKYYGGSRALTGGAVREFGYEDPRIQQGGQTEMDEITQLNEAQFDEVPQQPDYLPATNSSHPIENSTPEPGLPPGAVGKDEYVVHTKKEHPTGGQTVNSIPDHDMPFPKGCNPFHPFENPYDFRAGSWLLRCNMTNDDIRAGFNGGMIQRQQGGYRTSITSSYTLEQRVDNLHPEFGKLSWCFGEASFWADEKKTRIPYYFRDPTLLIKHIFKQIAYRDHLAYKPVRLYNENGSRIYSELCSGDWMWEQQDKIPVGGTVVPTLVTSDQTRLSTHVGGHMFWPLYMSIGNLHSNVRNRPSNNGWILLAQLPVPPAMRKHIAAMETTNGKLDKDGLCKAEYLRLYKAYKDDAFGAVVRDIFEPLQAAAQNGMELECADGFVRIGYPVMAAWLADFQEYSKIYTTPPNACCVCEVSPSQLGDNYIASRRDSDEHTKALQLYHHLRARIRLMKWALVEITANGIKAFRKLMEDKPDYELPTDKSGISKASIALELKELRHKLKMAGLYFEVRQSQAIDNALWKTGIAHVQDVWKPDLLHTIYEGMVMHVLTALEPFLAHHKRLDRFEEAWMRMPAFNNIPAPRRSIFETEQRTGKALRDTLRQLLPVLVIALDKPTAAQHFEFYDCLAACRYLVDFSLICQYRYHTDVSLGYLYQYLDGFHKHKNVFNDSRPLPSAEKYAANVNVDLDAGTFNYDTHQDNQRELEGANRTAHLIQQASQTKEKSLSELQSIAREFFTYDKSRLFRWLEISDNAEVFDFPDVIPMLEEIAKKREIRFLDQGAYWKIPKLHLCSHFGETITRFGYLQQYSSEVGETLHKGIKEAYRVCNKKEQTKQILQFHTRKFAVRMREMNLEALARDGLYQREIQNALSLYGDKKDRLLAAKLHRDGLGSIQETEYYAKQAVQALLTAERDLSNSEESTNSNLPPRIPTDEPWYIPSPLRLFPKIIKHSTGRKLVGNTSSFETSTIEKLAQSFELPLLASALRHYMIAELSFPSSVTTSDLLHLPTTTWNTLHLTTDTVQMIEPVELQKVVCSGPFRAPRLNTPRNDTVVFRDPDEYSALTKRDSLKSDFMDHRVGFMKCLFQVKIPLVAHWNDFLAAGISNFDKSHLCQYNLALIVGLQPIRYDNFGEMIPGALVGSVKLPAIVEGLNQTHQENVMATHNIQKRNGGRIFDVNSIARAVQIISQHSSSETKEEKKVWTVNNRSDLGIWDMLYSKATERDENPNAASEEEESEDEMNG